MLRQRRIVAEADDAIRSGRFGNGGLGPAQTPAVDRHAHALARVWVLHGKGVRGLERVMNKPALGDKAPVIKNAAGHLGGRRVIDAQTHFRQARHERQDGDGVHEVLTPQETRANHP